MWPRRWHRHTSKCVLHVIPCPIAAAPALRWALALFGVTSFRSSFGLQPHVSTFKYPGRSETLPTERLLQKPRPENAARQVARIEFMMDDDDDEGGSEATPAGAEPFSLALAKHAECLATVEPPV